VDIGLDERTPDEVEMPRQKKSLKEKWSNLKHRISEFFKNPKKRLIFIIVSGVLLIVLVAVGLYFLTTDRLDIFSNKDTEEEVTEVTYEAPLDGVKTDIKSANRYPLAIMIENHTDARPQSGLIDASIVYEALAEGGITRFMGIYGTNVSERVGPVRSARPYYVDWVEGYNAYYAHVGGNITSLDQIRTDGVLDLNQFYWSAAYWRDKNLGVATEHNMHTSTIKLREEATKEKYTTSKNFNVYRFKDDPEADSTEAGLLPESQKITVNFSTANFKVEFDYDKATNSYLRSIAGKPHLDRVSGNQLGAKNIAIMSLNNVPITTSINEYGLKMNTVGSGKAQIFLDGKEIKGTWKKTSKKTREIFYDAQGEEITFNRGALWICVVPSKSPVTVETVASTTPAITEGSE